jgi:hypothetical protein
MSSGQQYVYSVEIYQGAVFSLDLVAKNRKAIRARVARLITNRDKTHDVVRSKVFRNLTLLTWTHGGKQAVCELHYLRPRPLCASTTDIEIVVKAWVIKKANPKDGPVRGTLKERMGDRAWKPTIHLDVDRCPPEEKYPDQPPDGRVT